MSKMKQLGAQGFQDACYRIWEFEAEDFADTSFVGPMEIPGDAIVLGGFLSIQSAFDAATTLTVGTESAPASFLAATAADALAKTDLLAALQNAGVPLQDTIKIGLTPSAAMTQGKGYLVVWYIRKGFSQGTQG